MSINIKKEVCNVCEKTVYPTEQLKADDKIYHKACFRCEYCQGTLKLGSFASMDGRLFCKPHFKQLFNSKGNYSEGFGKLKPQQEFEAKRKGDNDTVDPKSDTIPTTEEKQIIKEEEVEIQQEHKVDEEVIETTQRTEINVTEVDTPQENHDNTHSNNHVEDATESIAEVKEESRSTSVDSNSADSTSVDSTPNVTVTVSASTSRNETNTNSPDIADNKTKRLTPVGSPKIAISQSKCCVCNKTVYDKERVREDNSQGETFIFHKACFRCKVCNNVLGVGNFAALNSEFYCKPHFKQLFASKGNYSEGFGLLKPQQEHDLKKAEQKN